MSNNGTVRHNLKKAVEEFREVKDKELGRGLRRLARGLEHINKQLKKMNNENNK